MKKITAILLCLIMVFSLGAITVGAAEKDDVKLARNDKADFADYFFGGLSVDFVQNYVCGFFVNEEDELFDKDTMTHPFNGDVVNKFLSENFALSDSMFTSVKAALGYDASTNIYHLPFIGGFGGFNKPREYVSYEKSKDNTYSLYYQTIDWLDLPDSEYKKIEDADEWPESVTYNGKTYKNSPDGYVCNNGYKDNGLVHKFEVKNGIARFISTEKYTGNKVPAPKPTDKEETKQPVKDDTTSDTEISKPEQTVTQTEGLVLSAVENTFEKDTVVKAEVIEKTAKNYEKVDNALKDVANKFVAYEITATKNNVKVQPNGTVTATFDIPSDFDTTKTTVYYVADDGKTEELTTTVDAATRKVTAKLTHFSTYVVAEKTNVETNNDITDGGNNENTPISPWIIVVIIVLVLAVVAVVIIVLIKAKKK